MSPIMRKEGEVSRQWAELQQLEEMTGEMIASAYRLSLVPGSRVMYLGRNRKRIERQTNKPSDGVTADLYLGVVVTCLYTMVAMGLIIAFT